VALSRRTGRSRFTLLLLVLTSVTVITLDQRGQGSGLFGSVRNGASDALAPVRDGAASVLSPVGDAIDGVTGYGDVKRENERLRSQVAALRGRALAGDEAQAEARRLSKLLGVSFVGDIPTIGATVVSAPVSNFEQTIELDRGSDRGIERGMPVVDGEGLVGKVVSVSGKRSVVRLVTDPSSSVGVRLQTSGDLGVAVGAGADRALSVSFIDPASKVSNGELVFTSGTDASEFPGDLPFAKVKEHSVGPADLSQRVEVTPVADLNHLRYVKVLKWTPSS
jgi:rod shape-determining protein MreC